MFILCLAYSKGGGLAIKPSSPSLNLPPVFWVTAVHGCLIKLKLFHRNRRKQHEHVFHTFAFRLAETPGTSIKQSRAITTHNTNRHCRVQFARQPLSKQLIPPVKQVLGSFCPESMVLNRYSLTKLLRLIQATFFKGTTTMLSRARKKHRKEAMKSCLIY